MRSVSRKTSHDVTYDLLLCNIHMNKQRSVLKTWKRTISFVENEQNTGCIQSRHTCCIQVQEQTDQRGNTSKLLDTILAKTIKWPVMCSYPLKTNDITFVRHQSSFSFSCNAKSYSWMPLTWICVILRVKIELSTTSTFPKQVYSHKDSLKGR